VTPLFDTLPPLKSRLLIDVDPLSTFF
jgi:hypothetical protein